MITKKERITAIGSLIESSKWYEDCAEANIIDILTDLMHFALAEGISFDNCLRIARNHYNEESQ